MPIGGFWLGLIFFVRRMQFCPVCDNKLYVNAKKCLKPAESFTDPSPFLYCRTCNSQQQQQADGEPADGEPADGAACDDGLPTSQRNNAVPDMCVHRTNYNSDQNQDLYFTTLVNEYSLNDKTLPALPGYIDTHHACKDATVRYICYDESNLKFLYLCDKCHICFKIESPNTAVFDWRLKAIEPQASE